MKWLSVLASFGLMAMLTVSTSGCKKGDKQTGSDAAGNAKYTMNGPADVNIDAQGKADATVKIDRKKGFEDGDVTVTLSDLPTGVKSDAMEKVIKGKDTQAVFMLTAPEAKGGETSEAKIVAKGGGADATAKFKITVKKKS